MVSYAIDRHTFNNYLNEVNHMLECMNVPSLSFTSTNSKNRERDSNAKTVVYSEDGIIVADIYDNGKFVADVEIIPEITDVKAIESEDGKNVVILYFGDDTTEKAVLDSEDTYSLEQGVSVCVAKKLISDMTYGNGSSVYNKIIDMVIKNLNRNRKETEKKLEEEKAIKEKVEKLKKKKEAKRLKKESEARESEIEMYKEAYLRAMKEFNNNNAVNR